ncbi:MAG: phosphotransferase [Planctomycetaceae bacterium]|nr:phosphotransferase [Planctomycetaceae bacterium]
MTLQALKSMHELTSQNTADYLHDSGRLPREMTAQVTPLAWGVSNVVLRVTPAAGDAFVVKQSRTRLRTKDPWFSRLDRIWREADAMRVLEPLLPPGVVPQVLFEDRENYLFAMQAAPADHVVWKQSLLEGVAEPRVASFLGTCLSALHRETAFRPELQTRFGDTEVFVQLRVDPFYRRVAAACPEIAPQIDRMIDDMFASPVCLVHADFSPKNVLLANGQIVLVDYETAHYGDPAFDLGFFLSHLLLKAVLHQKRMADYTALTTAFWDAYRSGVASLSAHAAFAPQSLVSRTLPHLAGCAWSRIDGTSKVDYLTAQRDQQTVRNFCRSLFLRPPGDWPAVLGRLQSLLVA